MNDRRRFVAASSVGGALAALLFAWLLTLGTFDLTAWQRVGDFYDAQAASLVDGHWDVPGPTLGIESFEARGNVYMYQGPWPALLRMPVVAVTDRFEGRMTQTSMLLAFAVAVAAVVSLHWRIRDLVRPGRPVHRTELWLAGVTTFAVTGGSALVYVSSRAWVYHEAVIWGVAWALVAFDLIVSLARDPRRRTIALATVAATLALWSRSSVGLGPLAALAAFGGGNLVLRLIDGRTSLVARTLGRLRWTATAPRSDGIRPVVGLVAATVTPLAAYAVVNWIKFRTFFSIPFSTQGFTLVDPDRQAMLAENNGTLFGLHFSPTTALQYLRPDALDLTRRFPFVDFPDPRAPIGGVRFDLIDRSTSIPVSMTALTALTVLAAVVMFRRRSEESGTGVALLRVPLLGGLVGGLTIIPFGYIANRYLADTVPLLAIGGLAGLQLVLRRTEDRRPSGAVLVGVGVTAAVVVAAWVNVSLALSYQRLYSPNAKDDVIAGYLDTTYDVAQSVGLDPDIPIAAGDRLPDSAPRGSLFVVGDCDGLYLSDGMPTNAVKITPWNPVERTEAGGRFLRTIEFPTQPIGTRVPIFSIDSATEDGILYAESVGGDGVAFVYEGPSSDQAGIERYVPADRTWTLDLVVDPQNRNLQLWLDDRLYLEAFYLVEDGTPVIGRDVLGREDVEDAFPGRLDPLPERTGLCRELLGESDRASSET